MMWFIVGLIVGLMIGFKMGSHHPGGPAPMGYWE